jgi:serine/threonine-protein kinase RsbW
VANKARLGEQEAFACRLALDEACVNIIEHAYANHETGEIEVTIESAPGVCTICLTDFGEPYDPSQVAQPRFGIDMEEANPGGLGLYLMRTMTDDVQYVVGPQGNSLIMVKRRSFQT